MNPLPLLWFGRLAIRFENIVRLEACSNYTWLYQQDGSRQLLSRTLAYYESVLPEHFLRVHRSHFINLNYLTSLTLRENTEIELMDGKKIPIARRRWQTLKAQIKAA
jgi:two-component system, LytTR family, response regulator